jgi:hypothetical protein
VLEGDIRRKRKALVSCLVANPHVYPRDETNTKPQVALDRYYRLPSVSLSPAVSRVAGRPDVAASPFLGGEAQELAGPDDQVGLARPIEVDTLMVPELALAVSGREDLNHFSPGQNSRQRVEVLDRYFHSPPRRRSHRAVRGVSRSQSQSGEPLHHPVRRLEAFA